MKLLGVFPGHAAPEFAAQTLDDKPLKLSDYRGKVVLIDFWATWCAPCLAELPNVEKAHEKYAAQGLIVIGVSFDQDAATARRFVEKRKLPWPQVWVKGADKSELAQLYAVGGIPATFLIGPDGKVVAKDVRGEELHKAIERQLSELKGAPPGPATR